MTLPNASSTMTLPNASSTMTLPNASSTMTCALGEREQHDVVVGSRADGCESWPVVSQVVHPKSCSFRPYSVVDDGCLARSAAWVVGGSHEFDVRLLGRRHILLRVPGPVKNSRLVVLDRSRVALYNMILRIG